MSPILCPHCGTANRAGSNFCNRCGASLRAEGAPPVTPPTEPEQPPQPPAEAPPGPSASQVEAVVNRPEPSAQPWLQPGYQAPDDVTAGEAGAEEDVDAGVSETTDVPAAPDRLVSGIQGLLEPIRYATLPEESAPADAARPPAPAAPVADTLDVDGLRRIRTLLAEEPILAAAQTQTPRRGPSLWIPWAFLLIGLAVAVPVLLQLVRPTGIARQWPGVQQAYAAINRLPPQAKVQVFWAYDPATAGELDLLAAPVLRHLLDRGAQPSIYSLLPNGPATARRLIAAVQQERRTLDPTALDAPLLDVRFLPGGVTVLPALGSQRADLAVVLAAQADDAQAWIEQVASRNRVPVVAVTAAGADPMLRPYLDSGQLVGLVSGFDGAAAYTALGKEPPTREREQQMKVQLVTQNVALLAFLTLIVAGNIVGFLSGRRGDD